MFTKGDPRDFAGACVLIIGEGFDPSEASLEGHIGPESDGESRPFTHNIALVGLELLESLVGGFYLSSEEFSDLFGLLEFGEFCEIRKIEVRGEVEIEFMSFVEMLQQGNSVDAEPLDKVFRLDESKVQRLANVVGNLGLSSWRGALDEGLNVVGWMVHPRFS